MMKNKSILLIALLPFALASCDESTSIRPQSSDDTATTSASVINPTSIISSISSGIGSIELQNTIDTAKLVVDKIRSSSIAYADEEYSYVDGIKNKPVTKAFSLIKKDRVYDNSVRIVSYTSTSLENSEHFSAADEDGKFISQYTYIDSDFKNIKTNLVTQKQNVAITKVKEMVSVPYSLPNYDLKFTILKAEELLDAIGQESSVELAGKLESGDVYVRFLLNNEESINEEYNMKQVNTERVEYFYTNNNISQINYFTEEKLISDESIEYPLGISTISQTFSISMNGNYDKSAIPMPDK